MTHKNQDVLQHALVFMFCIDIIYKFIYNSLK